MFFVYKVFSLPKEGGIAKTHQARSAREASSKKSKANSLTTNTGSKCVRRAEFLVYTTVFTLPHPWLEFDRV